MRDINSCDYILWSRSADMTNLGLKTILHLRGLHYIKLIFIKLEFIKFEFIKLNSSNSNSSNESVTFVTLIIEGSVDLLLF